MKILNLYAGIGGNRKLWGDEHEITAVEYEQSVAEFYKNQYPNDKVIIGDAHEYLRLNFQYFDFIWSSPPCPTHSKLEIANARQAIPNYPDMKLYQEIILLRYRAKNALWVVENVKPYYQLLLPAQEVGRHLWWANFKIGNYTIGKKPNRPLVECTPPELEEYLGIKLNGWRPKLDNYQGHDAHRKTLRNCVHPEIGLHILNAAQGIHTKKNEKQIDLFE